MRRLTAEWEKNMNESDKIIDARGLACPQPVVLTKKAFEEGPFGLIEVIVDSEVAKENVMRFARFSGRAAEALPSEEHITRIIIQDPIATGLEASNHTPSPVAAKRYECSTGTIIFIPSDRIGHGDDELGALLMRGFIYALAEGTERPERIILMNAGVKLAIDDSDSLANLKRLCERGVEILACGTCLEFFGLKERLAVGRVSNMYEIAELLLKGPVFRL